MKEKLIIQPGDRKWDEPDKIAKETDKKLHESIHNRKDTSDNSDLKISVSELKEVLQNSPIENPKNSQLQPISFSEKSIEPGIVDLNEERITLDSPRILDEHGNGSLADKQKSRIYTPGQQDYDDPIIKTVDSEELQADYRAKNIKIANEQPINNKEQAELQITTFLDNLSERHKIKNPLNTNKIKLFLLDGAKKNWREYFFN